MLHNMPFYRAWPIEMENSDPERNLTAKKYKATKK